MGGREVHAELTTTFPSEDDDDDDDSMKLLSALSPMTLMAVLARSTDIITTIPSAPPLHANTPLDQFLSYSIEFSSFVDYAGNLSHPNTYSDTLLENIAYYAGRKPLVRVGGNTQDLTIFNSSQKQAVEQQFSASNPDYPANQTIGPAFFESYLTWPGVLFSHGFNLAATAPEHQQAVLDSVYYACRTLRDKLYAWELGNEPDFYAVKALNPTPPRQTGYTEAQYVAEWLALSQRMRRHMQTSCPDLAKHQHPKFWGPSLAGNPALSNFSAPKVFSAGYNSKESISMISQHK